MSNECYLEDCIIKKNNCYHLDKCKKIREKASEKKNIVKELCKILNIKYSKDITINIKSIHNKMVTEIDHYLKAKSDYMICHSNFVAEANHLITANLSNNNFNNNLNLDVFKNLKELSDMVNKI